MPVTFVIMVFMVAGIVWYIGSKTLFKSVGNKIDKEQKRFKKEFSQEDEPQNEGEKKQ